MMEWLTDNLGNITVLLILGLTVGGIIASMLRRKKQGKTSCGCNCQGCAMSGTCHQQK